MGCDVAVLVVVQLVEISIHAARMGCDAGREGNLLQHQRISIHAARMGCDGCRNDRRKQVHQFQSTQPEWAATSAIRIRVFPM